MSDGQTSTADPKIRQALERLALSRDAYGKQVEREREDLSFQIPEQQWPSDIRDQRKPMVVQNVTLPARPMLSIPTLNQPIRLALNAERNAQLGVQVHPVSEEASDETAEVLQGLYRHIERDSRAHIARSWAHERAVKAGRGWYRVNKVLDGDSPDPNDQKIVIQRILYQDSVWPDPFSQEPDWSDGRFAFETHWMPWSTYKKKYKDSALADYDDRGLLELKDRAPEWMKGDGESRAVLIAGYWRREENEDGSFTVFYSVINAVEELEPEVEWDGQYIPLVPTIGEELIPFDTKRWWMGMIRPNMDGVRLVNYAASGLVEAAALETKQSVVLDPEAIENHEEWWNYRNIRNYPYLPYRRFKGTRDLGPPEYLQADGTKMQMNAMLLEHGREFVRIGTGAFEPTTGEDSSRAKSGRAVLALQQQHDQGNSHWLDNLANVSMAYEARVVLDLIPKVYDRPGRVARILDTEDNTETVMLNQPFTLDPRSKRPQPVDLSQAVPGQPMAGVKHYDLAKGRYGVSVSIGKAYKTRLEQGADELGQLFQAEPQLFQLLGDIYLRFRDFPGHTEAAERMKKMLPPQLQSGDQADPAQQVNALQQQLQQAGAQIQALSKELMARTEQIKTESVKHEAQVQIERFKQETERELERMKNATAIRIAEINAAAKGYATEAQHAAAHEAQALQLSADEQARVAQATEAENQRAHDAQMADAQRAHESMESEATRQAEAAVDTDEA